MLAEKIVWLLEQIGSERVRVGNAGWVYGSCPLAPWEHAGGKDRHPSFAVAIEPEGGSNFKCHSCGARGSLQTLIFAWERKSGETKRAAQLADYVQQHDQMSEKLLADRVENTGYWQAAKAKVGGVTVSRPAYHIVQQAQVDDTIPEDKFITIPEDFPPAVWDHLTHPKLRGPDGRPLKNSPRGYAPETLKRFEVRWHPAAERIVVPVRDLTGRLVCLSGRLFGGNVEGPKWMHTTGFRKEFYLQAENMIEKGKQGYIVEGPFDCMALWQKGYSNVVGVLGSYLSPVQEQKILQFFTNIVVIGDGDKAGREIAERIDKMLSGKMHVRIVTLPDGFDPDDLTDDEARTLIGKPERDPLTVSAA